MSTCEIMQYLLPQEEQVSNDFSIFLINKEYIAVRSPSEGGGFVVKGSNKDTVVAEAVEKFQQYILTQGEGNERQYPYWNNKQKKVEWRWYS